MSDQWRTDEPEVGQVAWLKNDPPFGPVVCIVNNSGWKAWRFAHGIKDLRDLSCPPWQPITTPEESRLRRRVEELIRAIQRHKNMTERGLTGIDPNRQLWGNLPEAGGE